MKFTEGTYVAPNGDWFDVEGTAIHKYTGEQLVVYWESQNNSPYLIAVPLHEVEKWGWRPIQYEDYGPGGPAEYYKEYGGS